MLCLGSTAVLASNAHCFIQEAVLLNRTLFSSAMGKSCSRLLMGLTGFDMWSILLASCHLTGNKNLNRRVPQKSTIITFSPKDVQLIIFFNLALLV